MKPVEPAEVSALLDGELSPERAAQVRQAISEDSKLRSVYEELSAVHRDLTVCAAAAQFQPRISLAQSTSHPAVGVLGFALGLLVFRVIVKLLPMGIGAALQVTALALILWWVSSYLLRLVHDERWRFAGAEIANTT